MGLKFKVNAAGVEVEPQSLLVEEIVAIWKKDTTPDKSIANRMLKAVYIMADEDSPFADAVESERWKHAIRNSRLTSEELEAYRELIEKAIEVYILTNVTTIKRSIDSVDRTIEQINSMLAETKPYIKRMESRKNVGSKDEPEWEEVVSFRSNADQITEFAKTLNDLIAQRDKMYTEYVKKKKEVDLRSGKQAGALSSGKLTNPVATGEYVRKSA